VRSTPPGVVAIFGPTASGKTAVAGALLDRLDAEVVSVDAAALYAGLPILTAAPSYPARLVGIVPLERETSVGEFQRFAHGAIDEILAAGRTAIVVGGTGLYLRAALSALELPPPPSPGVRERIGELYDELGPEAAHGLLAERDPRAAVRVHANDRRRVVRALELADAGASLAPPVDRLWSDDVRHPTLLVGLGVELTTIDARIQRRTDEMVEQGVAAEAAAAWAGPLSATARKILGLEQFATLPLGDAVEAVVAATRRLARYQRKWLRRLPLAASLAGERAPEETADDVVALASTGQSLSRRR
jgi:tRNA dimethylallyltransferase